MNRYKKQLIKAVIVGSIPVLIDGKVRGDFAIHECLDRFFIPAERSGERLKHQDCKMFTVTYIPRGCQLITSTIGKCQMFINKVLDMPWDLVTERQAKPPKGFPSNEYKSYVREFSPG